MTDYNISPAGPLPAAAGGRVLGRRTPPRWVWAFVAGLGLLGLLLNATDAFGDHAAANIATWILTFLVVLTLLLWYLLLSGLSRRARLLLLAAVAAPVATFLILFRVEHVSGELVPSFAFRFGMKPDQLMAPPGEEAAGGNTPPVDLRTETPDDFPEFLGPGRKALGTSVEAVGRTANNSYSSPQTLLVWRHPIGAGWSGFSVRNGHAVTMEQRGDLEMVTCYNVQSGLLEWSHATRARYETVSGGVGPRCTPTIADGRVFALGATGRLLCLDGATGRSLWEKDLLEQFGTTPEEDLAAVAWGRAASPLVVGKLVIVPAGGKTEGPLVSLAAFDTGDGHLVWEGGERQIGYSSPVLACLCWVEQVLIVNEDTASGHDVRTGRVLWEQQRDGHSNRDPNVSQAVPIPPDCVFLSKGYGLGAMLLRLVPKSDGTFDTEVVWQNPKVMRTKFTNVTVLDHYVYGLSDGILECVDLATGQRMWKEGRYHHGQLLRAGEVLVVMSESGEIVLVEATPEWASANRVLNRFQALEGKSWNTLAASGRYLLVRNATEAACYELGVGD
ncbi:MAG: PQQ-binding-like beta-propeller repeat protein [Thermoguttaceae bacterium]|jgi:outer membrane protein assembly factor BamB